MTIYRYELPDGGGPFFTQDGQNRIYSNIKFNDDTLSGCDSIEHLKEWFKIRNITIPDNAVIRAYEGEVVYWNCKTNEVIIQKNTALAAGGEIKDFHFDLNNEVG